MIKRNYNLIQSKLCKSPTTFEINETIPRVLGNTQISENQTILTQGHFQEAQIGAFQDLIQASCSLFCCCSCRAIPSTKLSLYGQQLSIANRTPSGCCFLPIGLSKNQLEVTTSNKLLIGKIVSQCSCFLTGCCSKQALIEIFDSNNKLIYRISGHQCCCEIGMWLPAWLRCCCGKGIVYDIVDVQNQDVVGNIQNLNNGLCLELCSFASQFQVSLPRLADDKQRILLLNAVLYLNVLHYQMM